MPSDDILPEAESAVEFERELADLIASAFARGATVEQTWEITVPVPETPNWTVEITKTYDDDADGGYDPDYIDD